MITDKKYYAAYNERYITAHRNGAGWSSDVATPIVLRTLRNYRIDQGARLLEIGCGEGRDARAVLNGGYRLTATDLSKEAIAYCRRQMPQYADSFRILDCLSSKEDTRYAFIYAVAVLHMLVLDEDRRGFYRFIAEHLTEDGMALICTMGDGTTEYQSDPSKAFDLALRDHPSGKMTVAATTCRMVSFPTFEAELERNGLTIAQKGITSALPDFDRLMYALVKMSSKERRTL